MRLLHHKLPPSHRLPIAKHQGNIHSRRPVAYVGSDLLLPAQYFCLVLLHSKQVKALQFYIAVMLCVFQRKGNVAFCGVGVNGDGDIYNSSFCSRCGNNRIIPIGKL